MKPDHMTFFRSYYEAAKTLGRDGGGYELTMAMLEYYFEGTLPELDGVTSALFSLARPNLDASLKKAAAGKASAKSRQKKPVEETDEEHSVNTTGTEREQNGNTTGTEHEQNVNNKEKEKDKDKDKDKGIGIGDGEGENPSPGKAMLPPTVEEVRSYCLSRGYLLDPQRFVSYYTASGWRRGNTPIRDWRAAVDSWVNLQPSSGTATVPTAASPPPETPAMDYGAYIRSLREDLNRRRAERGEPVDSG